MRSLTLSAFALSAAVAPIFASDLKVVNFENIPQKPRSKLSAVRFLRATAPDEVSLSNQRNLYAINLKVGTPQQNISVQIDTGSSDLWFPVTGSALCNLRFSECDSFGSYSTSSSTLKNLGQSFSITYGDGTRIRGTFVTDDVQVGDTKISGVQFAACPSGSSDTGVQGILGIGYEANEATASSQGTYPNLVSSMKSQGAINTLAYSMWLNDPDAAAGNVLFGGVDLAKFTGPLIAMPVVPDADGGYSTLSMPLTSVSFASDGQSFTFTPSNFIYPALIDSGTTLMYLPDDMVAMFYRSVGVTSVQQTPLIPCDYGNDQSAKMTFGFNGANGAKIDIQLQDLLSPVNYRLSGRPACELLVSGGAPQDLIILGDAFMRSTYLAYDLENNFIAIAQSKFNETSSNIKEINSDGIPSASYMSTIAGGASVQPSATSGIPNNGNTFASGGATGAVETTATAPSFRFTGTGSPNASTKNVVPVMSIFGVLAGTCTLLSVFGGAMIFWF